MNDTTRFVTKAARTDQGSWFSIHRRLLFEDKRPPIFPGNAHQQISTAVEDALYWANRGQCVYLAQGMQRNAGPMRPPAPYPSAIRQEPNLVACHSFYMDIDVKEGAYSSTKDALIAFRKFYVQVGLPQPTIIVGSGTGGFHVYWTIEEIFEPKEFRQVAGQLVAAGLQHGLIFDKQCTSDALRLLRVPGTWNFKGGPGTEGKPVTLMHLSDKNIPLDEFKAPLIKYKNVTVLHPNRNSQSGGKKSVNSALTGGMGKRYSQVGIDNVAAFCPFIAHTLETGGADLVGEPEWHQMAALACHTDDPSKTVHRLCEKNKFYDKDATEQKLADAQHARELRPEIGPPKCAKINAKQCAACPHYALNTTPLALPFKFFNNRNSASGATAPIPNSYNVDLPEGYFRGLDDLIYLSKVADTGENVETLVFEYPLIAGTAHIEAGIPYMFTFDTIQGEEQVTKRVPCSFTAGNNAFMEAMTSIGMPITVKPDISRTFMGHYLKLLQSSRSTMIKVPAFGWHPDHNGDMGFANAGRFFSPAGEFRALKPDDGVANYKVEGDDSVWTGLMNVITMADRPDLACLSATTFGAPLVGMTGENGFLIGLYSTESGIGKSTTLAAGQGVWSKPVVGGLTDTVNFTFAKCATLKHLPIIYDEIKGEKPTKSMVELVFQLTRGSEKGRSTRTGEMRVVREFETLCVYASNASIVDEVREYHHGTDADWLRMFEMQAISKKRDDPLLTAAVKERLIALKFNYGGIGMKYAKYLGENQAKLAKGLLAYQAKLTTELGADPQVHRFWIGAIATTLMGAHIANSQGYCKYPIDEMKRYMVGEFKRMQEELTVNPSDYSTDIALKNTFGVFLSEKLPRNTIILDKTSKVGRPSKNFASIKNLKTDNAWGVLEVQVSGDPLTIKISDSAFTEWCKKTNRPKSALIEQLKKKVGAKQSNTSIGSGTMMASARVNVWVIEATGTIFEDMLESVIQHGLIP